MVLGVWGHWAQGCWAQGYWVQMLGTGVLGVQVLARPALLCSSCGRGRAHLSGVLGLPLTVKAGCLTPLPWVLLFLTPTPGF